MKNISNSELKILQIIWKNKECTSLDIIKELESDWSKNTTRTFIKRLLNKNIIGITKKIGKTYYYYSLINEKEYKEEQVKMFIKNVFNGNIEEINYILKLYSR